MRPAFLSFLLLTGCGGDDDDDGFTVEEGDCNDLDASVHPDASEICQNDIDEDCNGVVDDGCPDPLDVDDDGDGYSENEGDCDDSTAALSPLATDVTGDDIDQNCDGVDGFDADSDGVASLSSGGSDCDDADEATFPDAVDTPRDGTDQDCDGADDLWSTGACSADPTPTGDNVGFVTSDFNIAAADGGTLSLYEHCAGVTVLQCGVMWSGPDKDAADELQGFHEAIGNLGLTVAHIWMQNASGDLPSNTDALDFASARSLTAVQAVDADGVCDRWVDNTWPTIVVIAPGGAVHSVYVGAGELTQEVIESIPAQ